MAKKKGKSRARRIGRRIKRAIRHPKKALVPVLVGAAGAALPFIKAPPGWSSNSTVVAELTEFMNDRNAVHISNAGTNFVASVEGNILEILGLGLVAAGAAYIGKKTGASRSTMVSNKWSLM